MERWHWVDLFERHVGGAPFLAQSAAERQNGTAAFWLLKAAVPRALLAESQEVCQSAPLLAPGDRGTWSIIVRRVL